MAKSIIIYSIALFSLYAQVWAQAGRPASGSEELPPAVCVWQMTGMYELPGQDAPFVEKIKMGEEVRLTSDSFLVVAEGKMYQKVKAASGKTGWVDKSRLVPNATPVAVIANSAIYQVPEQATSITGESFAAGEIAAMRDFRQGWILLIGQEKRKQGWVRWEKNEEVVSVSEDDLAIASLLQQAKKKEDPAERVNALEAIRQQPGFYGSALNQTVLDELQRAAPSTGYAPSSQPSPEGTRSLSSALAGEAAYQPPATTSFYKAPPTQEASGVASRGIMDMQSTEGASQPVVENLPTGGTITRENVYDTETGINYIKVTEMGTVLPVVGPSGREDHYFAYHKTLPRGARILLNIPDNPGFVELTVISKLGETRPQVVGLHPDVIAAVFGTNTREPQAQIIYFIRQ